MSSQEYRLRKLITDATFFINNIEEDETFALQAERCLDDADTILLDNTRDSYLGLSSEVIVMLVEASLLSAKRDTQAERILDIFFQRLTQEDQYFCRALLAQATIEERKIQKLELKGNANLDKVNHAFSFVKRAIDIAVKPENKAKYQFIVYNASIKTWHIIRGLMRHGWSKHLIEILERVSNLLEEADDSDFNWRCRYLNALCKAFADGDKSAESLKALDKLLDLTKKKGDCDFQETIFRNRIHMYRTNAGTLGNIKKETETGEDKFGFKALYTIQLIRSGAVPGGEAAIEKELQTLLQTIAPAAVSNDPAVAQQSQKIAPIMQDRVAECGRLAIKHNLIQYAEGACNVVARARQGSLRARIWTDYTRAELLLKKPSQEIDPKTGMRLNTLQRQREDFERRAEALKILDRAMIANKRLADADIIIEGCTLIWNTGVPLLKGSTRMHIYKPFQAATAALEKIEAQENSLRACLYLELAKYEIDQDFLSKATVQLKKALNIDYSAVASKLGLGELTEEEDIGDFERVYDKTIKFMLKKLSLKTNLYGGEPENPQDQILLDVENAKTTKNVKMRQTLLDKAVKQLQDFEEAPFEVLPEQNLVQCEVEAASKVFKLKQVRERKQRVLICSEIAKLAMEETLTDLAFEAATMAVEAQWDATKDADLVIGQSVAHTILAKCYVEFLLEEDIEIGHKDLVTCDGDQEDREFTADQIDKFAMQKEKFVSHIKQAVALGQSAKQTWLVFNAATEFWNNYLPIFKQHNFYELTHPEGIKAMEACFEGMNEAFTNGVFSAENVDYELDKKMNTFSNLSILLARIFEHRGESNDAVRVCDTLLQKALPPHLRKTFDSIKARVTKSVSNLAAQAEKGGAKAPPPKPGKGGATESTATLPPAGPSKTDILTSEVLSYLELIQNGNKDMIQKAMDSLNQWQPNEQDEIELELNVELWCRLGRLAINVQSNAMYKVALYCADVAIKNGDSKAKQRKFNQIPTTRSRWYAVAEALYGEALYLLLDKEKQEKESQDKLLHVSTAHFVESCHIASVAGISYLVLESAKQMWNALLGLLDAPHNRKLVIKPMAEVHGYLKSVQESSDPDFLALYYSALFQCITEVKDWKLGETITDEAFQYVPQSHQKVLWEAKMNFLSKLGKNVLNAISNMKENNPSLMAKVWVRLARSSANQSEQNSAYNRAIEILRTGESVEVVEVLIEYAEWLHRHKYPPQDVEDQLLLAVDTLMDIEPGWDDEDEEIGAGGGDEEKTRRTGQTGSSRRSRAMTKKSGATRKSGLTRGGKSMAGKSKVSKASQRSATMRSQTSRASKKTTTALSKRQEEDAQPRYLTCQHFDKLIRIHSMLAMFAPDAAKQREYALDAHFFVMKMWEQSFSTLNATVFFEKHAAAIKEQFGLVDDDQESRREYFAEIFCNSEIQIPNEHSLPDKPEDWTNFELPAEFMQKTAGHEDKIMVAKWTFLKPELTYLHLKKVAELLENHYFSVQLMPVMAMLEFFSREVLEDKILAATNQLARSRLVMNLGLKDEGVALQAKAESNKYELSEEERKVNFEKIKALKDTRDNLKDEHVPFEEDGELLPHVVESIRIHESWLAYAEELLRWGEFVRAKVLLKEASLHARILKDQDSYAKALLLIAQIQYLEGESAASLRTAMVCHAYARDIQTVEQAIHNTFNLLYATDKFEDCERLLDPAIEMLVGLRRAEEGGITAGAGARGGPMVVPVTEQSHINLPLEYCICTCYVLRAILSLRVSQNSKMSLEDSDAHINESFNWADQFEQHVSAVGFKEQHMILLLRYAKLLWQEICQCEIHDVASVEKVREKLTQCASFLIKAQKQLQDQLYFIGIHQDSATQNNLSLPLVRLLGVTKLRIAQINTTIGVIKNNIKTLDPVVGGNAASAGGANAVELRSQQMELSAGATEEQKAKLGLEKTRLKKIAATWMDGITKQIDALSDKYKSKMNRYEKSIAMLYTAQNMIHEQCVEFTEVQVEIAKNRRLLAISKKHLRGQWRQDAIAVDEINLDQIVLQEGQDRKDQLDSVGIGGEVADQIVDYKKEMLKSFLDLVQEPGEENQESASKTIFDRLIADVNAYGGENVLGTFAQEFAEARANLNKEQAFFYILMYQYSVSRQQLLRTYLEATMENHPDVRRRRALELIKSEFSMFTCPVLPETFYKTQKELNESSKPLQILSDYFSIDAMKEGLPSQSAFLSMQLSADRNNLYVGYVQISKERKFTYYVTKVDLTPAKKEQLSSMVSRLNQSKISMQKTPITIMEDLTALEAQSEAEIQTLMADMEEFFQPVTEALEPLLNPATEQPDEDVQVTGGKGASAKKEEAKKPPPKAAAKPAKGGAGAAQAELGAYESGLPTTAGGVESVIVCVDHRFETLPIEGLSLFRKAPVVSRDLNVHLHMNRLKTVGHRADLHNNRGVSKEELKYIVDIPTNKDAEALQEDGSNYIKEVMTKKCDGSKWEGILTGEEHSPSIGEWQRLISQSQMFAYFSMTCLLHKFPKNLISDLSIFNNCRAMVVFDRMNSLKQLIDRDVLTSKHFTPDDQPMRQVALFSLCGVSSVTINHWSTRPEANLDALKGVMNGTLGEGLYVNAALRKHWAAKAKAETEEEDPAAKETLQEQQRAIYKHNIVTFGVPIIRVV